MSTLFPWFSATGATGLVALLVVTSAAAVNFMRRDSRISDSLWKRLLAPSLSVILGLPVLFFMMTNVSSLLGVQPGSLTSIVVPAAPMLFGLIGLIWAGHLSRARPEIYRAIGHGHSGRRAALSTQLAHLDV